MPAWKDQLIEVIKADVEFETNKCINPKTEERERLIAASKIEAFESVMLLLKPKEE